MGNLLTAFWTPEYILPNKVPFKAVTEANNLSVLYRKLMPSVPLQVCNVLIAVVQLMLGASSSGNMAPYTTPFLR